MENCSISLSAASFRTLYLFFLPSTMIQWLCLFSILGYVLVHILVSFLCGSPPNGLVLHTISPCMFSLFSPSFLALSSTMNLYPQDVIHSIDNLRFDKQPSPSFLHGYAYLYDKLYSSSSLCCNQLEFWMHLRMYDILLRSSGLDATLYGHMHRSELDFSPQDISLSGRRNPLYLPYQHNGQLCIESPHL